MNRASAAIIRAILLGTSCLSTVSLVSAQAQPTGGQVVLGTATITSPNANTTVIDQKTGKAIINWNSFSIGAGGEVRFNQPNGNAIALNRVLGGEASSFYGKLLANGQVWIINQNGILFGKGGTFNVGGILATTSDISDTNFAAGDYKFSGGTGAAVVNQGTIRTSHGGAVLSGASVQNQGLIEADAGTVVLGGAKAFTVDFVGDGLIKYAITQPADTADNGQTGVANSGTINAPGGRVVMTARAAASVQDAVVNNTGMISATSARVQNGEVILDAGDGNVADSGTINASGAERGQTGGSVSITGHNITVADGARIDVSGDAGGGSVRIGGDVHGQGALPTAANTHVGRATITADATRTGNGGTLVVWSNGITDFSGIFTGKGAQSGAGGFIETSGHYLSVAGASINAGHGGVWLLDPYNLSVEASPATSTATPGPPGTWSSNSGGSVVLNSDINAVLDSGTSVILQTSGALGDGFGNGDITINAPILKSVAGAGDLTLLAAGSIIVNASIGSALSPMAVTLNANTLGSGGYVHIAAPITTNGGILVIGGGANPSTMAAVGTAGHTVGVYIGGALTTSGGNITINGTGYQGGGTASGEYGVYVHAAISAGAGDVSITGMGGNSSGSQNYGIRQDANITVTGAHNITLVGTGGGTGNEEEGYNADHDLKSDTGSISITGNAAAASGNAANTGITLSGGTISTGGNGTITIAGTASGSGGAPNTYGIYWNGGVASVVDGLLSVTGTNTSAGTGNQNMGLRVDNGTLESTGAGGITLVGTAGGTGGGGLDVGVWLNVANAVQSLGTGDITITGTGGGTGGSGSFNYGVYITQAIASHGGAISITGTGGGSSGNDNLGILQFGSITNTGNGSITLFGTGGGTGDNEQGYFTNRDVTSDTGAISITGIAAAASGNVSNAGVTLGAGGTIATGGSGTITIVGTGSASGSAANTYGINVDGIVVSVVDGLLSMTGTNNSTSTGDQNIGLFVGSGTLKSTGSGGITLVGTAGGTGGSALDVGVNLNVANAVQSLGTGAITITGTGGDTGGSGNSNYGVYVTGGIASHGGAIFVTGTGGASSGSNNVGIYQTGSITNTGTGGITLVGNAGITLDGEINTTGAVSLSGTGDIFSTVNGIVVGSSLTLNTTGDVSLLHTSNTFGTLTIVNAANAAVRDTGAVEIDGVTVTGTFALTGTGAITQGGTAGDAISAAVLSVSTTGAITLGNTSNAFAALKIGNGSNATVYDNASVEIDGATVTGTFALTGTGAITQGGTAGDAISAAVLSVSTTGAITLGNTSNAFAALKIGNGSNATVYDNASVEIDGAIVTGTFALTGTGAITQGGTAGDAISAAALNVSTAGAITLGNTSNAFALLTVVNGSSATIHDTGNVEIDGATVTGTFALTGTGAITQGVTAGDAINAAALNVSTTGAITLGNTSNAFGTLTIGNGSGATVYDTSNVEIDGAAVTGTLMLTSTGAITQGGTAGDAINAAMLSVSASGAITLGNHANAFGILTIGSGTDALVYDGLALEVDGASLTGSLSLTDIGAISQGGTGADAISASALVLSAGGTVTLGNTANSFGVLTVNSGTDVSLYNAGDVEIDGVSVSGTLALTTTKAITQGATAGDAISAAALNVSTTGAITLGNTSNTFSALTIGNAASATIYDAANVEIDGATVAGVLALTSGGLITQGGTVGDAVSAGTLSVSTTGAITLGNTSNAFGALTIVNAANATVYDTGAVEIDGVTMTGTFALTGTGAITQGATAGDAISAGTLSVSTTGVIALGNTANAFGTLIVGNGASATIYDTSNVEIDGVTVAGTLALTGEGAITQGGTGGDAIVAGALNVSTAGAITLLNHGNAFGVLTVGGASAASLYGTGDIEIDGATVAGTLTLTGTKGITQGSGTGNAINAAALVVSTTGGDITFGNSSNVFGTLTVGGATNATIGDTSAVEIDGATVTGTLTIIGTGAITQGGTAGDAIGAAVLNVSTTGVITLGNTSNAFAGLKIGNGSNATVYDNANVEIDGVHVNGTLALTGTGAITQGGTAGDAISAGTLRVGATGAITLGNVSNAFAALTVVNGSSATIADTGTVEIEGAAVAGALALASTGAITQGSTAADAIAASALNVSTGSGAITLANANNVFTTLTILTHGSDAATLTDSTGVTVSGANVGGTLTLAAGGAVSQTGAIHAAALDVSSGGTITLAGTGNTFATLAIGTGTAATIYDAGDIQIAGIAVTGTLTLTGTGAITQVGVGGDRITAQTLNISANGVITLHNVTNAFGVLTIANGTSASIADTGAVEVDGAFLTGTLTLGSTGAITQGGTAGDAIMAGSLDVSTSSGPIILANAANAFSTLAVLTHGLDDATLTSATGVTVAQANVGGTLTLAAGGAVGQSGAIHAAALNVSSSGAVTLNNAGNTFGRLTIGGATIASLHDTGDVEIDGASVTGALALTATGAISQGAAPGDAIIAPVLSLSAGGGIALLNHANAFGVLTLSSGADASIYDAGAVEVDGASVTGTLALATGGAISQAGGAGDAIHAGTLDVSTSSGAITLGHAGNVFGMVTVLTHGSDNATLTDSTGVTIAGVNVGGAFGLAAGGAMSQSSAIHAAVLNVSTTSGAITLTDVGNVFGTVTILTHGSDNATLTDSTGVSIASATVGGALTLGSGAGLTQTGAINAAALNVTATGAIALNDHGNVFHSLSIGGGTAASLYDTVDVEIDGAVVSGTLALTGAGAVNQGSAAGDAISASILNVSASGAITLGHSGNAFSVLTIGGGSNATLYDTANVEIDGVSLTGTLALTGAGTIDQGTGAGDAIAVSALNVATGNGSITLGNANNAFSALTVLTHGSDSAMLTDGTAVSIAGATVGGTLTVSAGGAISQSGAIHAAALDVSTASGAIVLANAGNAFGRLTVLTHGADNATLTDSAGVIVSAASVGGTLTLAAGGTIGQGGAIHAAAVDISTVSGAIDLTNAGNAFGALTVLTHGSDNAALTDGTGVTIAGAAVGGRLTLTVGGAVAQLGAIHTAVLDLSATGAITLLDHANTFDRLTIRSAPAASLYSAATFEIDGATVAGTLALTGAGDIGQGGSAGDAISSNALILSAGGAIALLNHANVFGQLTIGSAATASLYDAASVEIDGAAVTGRLSMIDGGAISQGGTASDAVNAAALDLSAGSTIVLGNAANVFAALTVQTQGANGATFRDSTGVNVTSASVGGTLTLAADGGVTQSGSVHAAALDVSTSSGAIMLADGGNVFGTLTVLTHGSDDAAITDSTGVSIAGATVGGALKLTAGGAISQTGAIRAAALNVSTASGAVILTDAGNAFATLTVLTRGFDDATFTDGTGVTVAGAKVGGTLSLAAGGPVAQTGAITATALNVSTSSGAITLDNANNVFGTLVVLTHGADSATFTDSTSVTVAAATVGGTLTIAAGGAVAQSGAITANALNVSTSSGAVDLENSGNVFVTLTLLTHGSDNAAITDSTGVSIAGATAGGAFTLVAGGAVTQTGAIHAPVLNVSTATGAITLTNAGNVFSTLTLLTHGSDSATLVDATGLTIGGAAVGGTLNLVAGGAMNQTGAIHAAALDVSTANGAIVLTDAGNVFSTLTLLTHGSDGATVTDSVGVSIAGATVGGTLSLAAGGAVTQTGAIRAAALDVSTATGAITLTNAGNAFSTLTLLTHGPDSATITDSTGVLIASAAVGGTLTLVTGGAVTQNGAIRAAALDVSTSAGSITLGNAGNVFSTLTLLTHGPDNATITDSTGVSIASATVGGALSLAAGGAITQTGAIRAASLNLSTASGAITLTNAANAFGTLTVLTHALDSVTLADSMDVIVAGAVVGGDLTLLSTGNIGVATTVQSATGALALVAGWDSHTLAPVQFGNSGVFGNNGKGVTIGGASAGANASFGSASGMTSIYGASLNVAAVHGYAQLGTNGHGAGSILVKVNGNVSVTGGAGTGQFGQIGNGGLGTSGNNSGDITIAAGGNLVLAGGSGTEAYVQIGHGGAESNVSSSGYSNTGAIAINAADVTLTAGSGNASYAQIGMGGFKVGDNLRSGNGNNIGTITVNASGTVVLSGGGADAYVQIGNGGDQVNTNASATAGGAEGGDVTVTALASGVDAVTLTGGTGANAYAMIGNGGYAANRNGTTAKATKFTMDGNITVSDLRLVGGSGADNAFVLVGNGDVTRTAIGNVGGNITVDTHGGAITVINGAAPHSLVGIGHYTGGGTSTGRTSGLPTDSASGQGVLAEDANGTKRAVSKTTGIGPQSSGNGSGDTTPGSTAASFSGVIAGDGSFATLSDSAAVFISDSLSGQRNSQVRLLMAGLLVQIVPTNARGFYGVPPADQDFSSWGNEALWQ